MICADPWRRASRLAPKMLCACCPGLEDVNARKKQSDRPERFPVDQDTLQLPVKILPQPDETTCGPTCLHAVYRYWGEDESLTKVIQRTGRLEHGGTFAVFLACDALRRGYNATIYTYNLNVFDPTWFTQRGIDIADRLQKQRETKMDYRLQHATTGYLEFLSLGGRLRLLDLSRYLIRGILRRRLPIITGLSSTYLYRVRARSGRRCGRRARPSLRPFRRYRGV
jgi:hypothetical protein